MSDKALEEWIKHYAPYETCFNRIYDFEQTWHASGEYHTEKTRSEIIKEVIEILEKMHIKEREKTTQQGSMVRIGIPDRHIWHNECLDKSIDAIRKRFKEGE